MSKPPNSFLALLTSTALVACTATPAAPIAADDVDDVFTYLRARHDANGDGTITPDEHGRGARSFERLDVDGDGILTAADFEGLVPPERGSGMGIGMARRFVGRYFQTERDADLPLDEAWEAIATYYDGKGDTPADGTLTVDEFTCSFESRRHHLPGDDSPMVQKYMDPHDPWVVMTIQIDDDGDGAISRAELGGFYDTYFDGEPLDFGPRDASDEDPEEEEETDGLALPGTVAPDFTLTSPDGGESVTLSSFAGDRPVALIFGSYT